MSDKGYPAFVAPSLILHKLLKKEAAAMKYCIIPISTQSYAIKGEKLLKSKGIRARMTKVDPAKTPKGCAFGLEIECSSKTAAYSLLSYAKLPFSDVIYPDDLL